MAVQELNFQGINRAITDYAVTGACEELINIRPTSGGLVPVKDFTVKMQDFPYDAVYVHYAGGATNYIAIFCGADGHVDIVHLAEDGSTITILTTLYLSAAVSPDNIHFAAVGNYFLISICDRDNGNYRNRAFLWDGSGYISQEAGAPDISISITPTPMQQRVTLGPPIDASIATESEILEIIHSAFNDIIENNKDIAFGYVVIAIVLKTKDNKQLGTMLWRVYNPMPDLKETTAYDAQNDLFWIAETHTSSDASYWLFGSSIEVSLTLSGWNESTSLINKIEVYASKPVLYIDPDKEIIRNGKFMLGNYQVPPISPEDLGLENQLLYLQKEVLLNELSSNPQPFYLEFGGNIQITNTTLEVDSGVLSRFGKVVSYNARFHYFDSVARIGVSTPYFAFPSDAVTASAYVFVHYQNDNKEEILYVGTENLPAESDLVIASSIHITDVVTIHRNAQTWFLRRYSMTPSSKYNYSICEKGCFLETPSSTPPQPYMSLTTNQRDYILHEEPDAINVTEQYNPFVFNVKNSYLAPGKVLDVQPQMVAVRDVTFGDYPLNVFTDRGTYALLQGNGQVLYGNFRSMSNLVSTANSVPTEHGTFFLAAGGLWAVAGSDAILISDALHLGPHKYIRDCAGYQALSASGVGYNVANYVSEVPFEEFTKCAKLSYNRFRDELIVSNNFYRYSYVLSLKYRQWFKIDRSLFQDNVGVNIAKLGNKPVVATVTSSLVASVTGQIIKVNYIFNVQRESGLYTRVEITLDLRDEGDIAELLEAALQETILTGTAVTATVDSDNGTLTAVFSFPATITGGVNGYTESLRGIPPTYSPTMVDSTSNMSISRTTEVIDLSEETDGSVRAHLQSRPFSFNGFGYSHVHRIVDMVRTALAGSDKLIVGLYGSDDLQNWTLLSYGARTSLYGGEPLEISQLRTPPAARSWRYYTVCIGGTIPTDTDFGPVMVDYEPVIRRLG